MEETTKQNPKDKEIKVKSSRESLKLISRWEKGMLILLVVAVLGVFVWVFFGRLETTISGIGVVSIKGQVEQIMAFDDLIVTDIPIKVGDRVKSGQKIAQVYTVTGTEELSTTEIKEQTHPIFSEVDAYITELPVNKWDFVDKHDHMACYISVDENSRWVVYMAVKLDDGKKIAEGMKAEIEVEGYPVGEYGNLTGVVTEAGYHAQSEDSLFQKFGNHYYAETFLEYGRGLVEIELDCDDDGNPIFTSGISGENFVPVNCVCQVTVHVKEGHPIDFISGK